MLKRPVVIPVRPGILGLSETIKVPLNPCISLGPFLDEGEQEIDHLFHGGFLFALVHGSQSIHHGVKSLVVRCQRINTMQAVKVNFRLNGARQGENHDGFCLKKIEKTSAQTAFYPWRTACHEMSFHTCRFL